MKDETIYKLASMNELNNEVIKALEFIADTLIRIEDAIVKLNKSDNEVLSANDLQKMGFSRIKAYQILSDEKLPVMKLGRLKYVKRDDLEKYLKGELK